MNNLNDLVVCVGLPGCGKSTYRLPYGDAVLSTDNYIEMFALINNKTYNEVFESQIKNAENTMYDHMRKLIQENRSNIIWDQPNLTTKTRQKKLERFNQAGGTHYRKIALFFEPDLQLSIIRNQQRRAYGRGIKSHILENMFATLEVPTKSEGFDYVFHVPASSQG